MRISQRELFLSMLTLAALLIGVTFIVGRPVLGQWKSIGMQIDEQRARLDADRKLIDSRGAWEDRFVNLSQLMPAFPADKKMDVHWLTLMDQIASKNDLTITKRQAGEEEKIGDVYELTIDVREWEGSLDSLVYFLFDLHSLGVMLDIQQLYVKPLEGNKLRGRFTLNCAYSKKGSAGQ